MSEPRPHLKALEEIERKCVPVLVEVLRAEGIEDVRYALWDMTGWHRDYDPCVSRTRATDRQKPRCAYDTPQIVPCEYYPEDPPTSP